MEPSAFQAGPEPFLRHPLAQLAGTFALGVLADLYLSIPLARLILLAASSTLFAVAAFLLSTQKNGSRIRSSVATALVMAATLFLGATLAALEKNRVPANQLRSLIEKGIIAVGEPVELTGVLERDPELAPGVGLIGLVFKVQAQQAEFP